MPYKIKKAGDKFQVVKVEGGKVMGTHPSRTKARAQLRALYANEADKSGGMKQVMTRDEALELIQELHDISMELGATCGAMAEEGEPEEEAAETPEEEATEPVEGEGEQGSPEVGTEEYADGTSEAEQARASREEMNAQYQEQQARVNESEPGIEPKPGYSRRPGKKSVDVDISLDTMRFLCPDCAAEMERKGFKSVKWSALKQGDVSNLAEHMKKKLGGDPHFFTKCMEAEETAGANNREALCARLHKEVTGEWPAEHGGKSAVLSVNYIKSLHVSQPEQFFRDVVAVKATGKNTIKGYLALWGDPDTVDIESEFFTGEKSPLGATDFWDKSLALPRPLTWSHAQDKATKQIAQVGALVELGDDDVGRWYVAQLDLSHRYRKAIDKLVSQRAIGTSSDSAPQYVIRQPVSKGATWLKQWPLFAAALTTTPCEPRMIGSVDYFKSLGIDLGELANGTEAAQKERARRAELEKRVQSLQRKERLLKLYV